MVHIISIHSFRGGTGKSNTSANLAAIYAKQGLRVGIFDTDIQSPGIHVLFNLTEDDMDFTLNSYLWGQCTIEQAAYDVTKALQCDVSGCIYLVPSSVNVSDIARVLRDGYDVNLLSEGFKDMGQALNLDVIIVDTHPGLSEETLLAVAISKAVLVVMRPDYQDYQGTGLTIEVARELDVPKMKILVNKAPESLDPVHLKHLIEETYHCPVIALIPHSDEMMTLASQGVFTVRYSDHPITQMLQEVAEDLLSD